MAFRRSYSSVKKNSEPTTFAGKYGLKKVAGMNDVGTVTYVVPLDIQNGYVSIPYHTLKRCGDKGFRDSIFNSVKILCHKYNQETGEALADLPLCCKLAQMEKDRKPDQEQSAYRALTFTNWRNIIPVMVLATSEEDIKKKPSLKKVSLNGVSFSYLDLAQSTYDQDLIGTLITDLEADGILEDANEMDPEELLTFASNYLQHSIIKISNVASGKANIPYVKTFKVLSPEKNVTIGEATNENKVLKLLGNMLAGEINPEKLDAMYAKYPILKDINNQVIDYISLFNDNVDSLVEDWEDIELQDYYNSFIDKQEQVNQYKDVNDQAQAAKEEDEEVSFTNTKPAAKPKAVVQPTVDDEDEEDFIAANQVQKAAPKKELVGAAATKATTEESFDYSSVQIEEDKDSILNDSDFASADIDISSEEFDEDDFTM